MEQSISNSEMIQGIVFGAAGMFSLICLSSAWCLHQADRASLKRNPDATYRRTSSFKGPLFCLGLIALLGCLAPVIPHAVEYLSSIRIMSA